jgi:hypothetical protein
VRPGPQDKCPESSIRKGDGTVRTERDASGRVVSVITRETRFRPRVVGAGRTGCVNRATAVGSKSGRENTLKVDTRFEPRWDYAGRRLRQRIRALAG